MDAGREPVGEDLDEGGPGGDLIGRGAEVEALTAAIRDDLAIAVVGEAGIGKTTLVRAAIDLAGRHRHEGGGFATLSWLPYLALRRAIGMADLGDPRAAAGLVESVVGPDVLFIDDLQWTDDDTQAVVALLVGRIGLVVAVRDGDAASESTLRRLDELGVRRLQLGGLDRRSATALAARARPELSGAALSGILDRAGGNPLLIEELAVHGETSSSLVRAITAQLETLPAPEQDVLRLLALAGKPIARSALEPASGSVADRLVERGILLADPDGYAVRHALIADAIVDQLDGVTVATLHRRIAGLVLDPAERAGHLAAAGDMAAAHAIATESLATTTDPRARAALLTIAARSAGPDSGSIRVQAGRELASLGRLEEATELLEPPIDGDDELRAIAAASLAGALGHNGFHDEALAALDGARSLRISPTSQPAIELAVTEASTLINSGRLADALAVVERARAAMGEVPSYRLDGHLAALRLYAGLTDQLDDLARAVDAAFAAGDAGTASGRAMDLYYVALDLRGVQEARALADELAGRIDATGYHTRALELRADAVQATIFAGDLRAAVVDIDSLLEGPLGRLSRQRLGYNRGLAMGLLGRTEDADRTLAEVERAATDDFDGKGGTLWCWSEASFWGGRPRRSRELAEASLSYLAFRDSELVLPSLARAWAEVELGEAPSPLAVEPTLRIHAGARPELAGLHAVVHGDHGVAVEAFDEAAALWAGYHIPRELLCAWAAADATRRAGDAAAALRRLEPVLERAAGIGFEPLAARVRRSMRLAGGRASRPAASRRDGAGLLTGREREILALVERGLTNAEIARRVSLGRPTVARLLSNAMVKLGAESRAQAVVLASRLA